MSTPPHGPQGTYADGTLGHSGSDASRERAEHERDTGDAAYRQHKVLAALGNHLMGPPEDGHTWAELDDLLGWHHHGRTTGALSTLHKAGHVARLADKRNGSSVYVLPEYVLGRTVVAQGRSKATLTQGERHALDRMRRRLENTRALVDPSEHVKAAADDLETVLALVDRLTGWASDT
jgi:hypothetical protein